MLTKLFGNSTPALPTTVDEALGDLTIALSNLEAVRASKAEEANDLAEQVKALQEMADEAKAEAERATRIHGNISALLA